MRDIAESLRDKNSLRRISVDREWFENWSVVGLELVGVLNALMSDEEPFRAILEYDPEEKKVEIECVRTDRQQSPSEDRNSPEC